MTDPTRMARFAAFLTVLLLIGCQCVPCRSIRGIGTDADDLLDDYSQYVELDDGLAPDQKARRLRRVDARRKLLRSIEELCGE